jgi:cyclophilin family peptidyl-prolyl cis-trans isomerase
MRARVHGTVTQRRSRELIIITAGPKQRDRRTMIGFAEARGSNDGFGAMLRPFSVVAVATAGGRVAFPLAIVIAVLLAGRTAAAAATTTTSWGLFVPPAASVNRQREVCAGNDPVRRAAAAAAAGRRSSRAETAHAATRSSDDSIKPQDRKPNDLDAACSQRRRMLQSTCGGAATASLLFTCCGSGAAAWAQEEETTPASTTAAAVTDKIYINVRGLPGTEQQQPQRIVIGLFGRDAPACTQQLKRLVTKEGLPSPCRPRAVRSLQKEQLEANKVYNSCIEQQDTGVTLQYSGIWRIIKNERIDLGAVTGKFVAREYPLWEETVQAGLKHDEPGVVSVRRGKESGFGFTIFPGGDPSAAAVLDHEHIVVGRVLEGMDIVEALNNVPVIASSKVNYMALTGGPKTSSAPDRSCRYGGPMYCNENKPLVKLSITDAGILPR